MNLRPAAYGWLMSALGADRGMEVFVREVLRPRAGDNVLDLGCGPGRLYPHLSGIRYLGVDIDGASIARARRLYPGACFRQADAAHLTALTEPFDAVVACGLLHHLSDEAARRVVRRCHGALRAGGRLITLDCVRGQPQPLLSRALTAFDRGAYIRRAGDYGSLLNGSFRHVTLTERQDLLRLPYRHAIFECVK